MSKYPHINIALVGEDGNAFSILGRCTREMKRNGLADKVDEFIAEATSGDYSKLLVTVMDWFSCDETDDEEQWYEEHPHGCYPCRELYAVGGCPACGE